MSEDSDLNIYIFMYKKLGYTPEHDKTSAPKLSTN